MLRKYTYNDKNNVLYLTDSTFNIDSNVIICQDVALFAYLS